jgi:hypothetical protein
MTRVKLKRTVRVLVPLAVMASALMVDPSASAAPEPDEVDPDPATSLEPAPQAAAAPGTQVTIWNATDSQTANSYWEPPVGGPANLVAPTNYAGGRAYIRIVVETKPSTRTMKPMVCFWRHADGQRFKYETCRKAATFSRTGTYYTALGTPTGWWKKGGSYDWRQKASVGRIMLTDPGSGKIFMSSKCGRACYRGGDLGSHIPVRMSSQLIFVANGSSLVPPEDWVADCPRAWSPLCEG